MAQQPQRAQDDAEHQCGHREGEKIAEQGEHGEHHGCQHKGLAPSHQAEDNRAEQMPGQQHRDEEQEEGASE